MVTRGKAGWVGIAREFEIDRYIAMFKTDNQLGLLYGIGKSVQYYTKNLIRKRILKRMKVK